MSSGSWPQGFRLTPPKDYTNSALALALGIGTALVIHFTRRSSLPFAGDLTHSLPHGGCYRDGTKSVTYNRPSTDHQPTFIISTLAILLPALIYLSSRFSSMFNSPKCAHCRAHMPN
ncbi:ORF3 [Potexvirus sp.]|uniref:ORF3 n=1 Tax=Potexvirus sp. TaxID=2283800 RepID=UPI000E102898|nr:ORF3 [Potexvirus sp.]AXG65488.1 ORF3 [Potexvirus sp.]